MQILTNSIIRYNENSENPKDSVILYRVLYIDPQICVLFALNKNPSDPIHKTRETLEKDIGSGTANIESEDPFAERLLFHEDDIPKRQREKRDFLYSVVLTITTNAGHLNFEVFDKTKRRLLIKKAAQKFKISEKNILRTLRKFWERGMSRDSLLPDYEKSGAPGRKRKHKNTKLGRPNIFEKDEGKAKPIYDSEQEQMIMYEGLKKYLKPGVRLTQVLDKIHQEYYCLPNETILTSTGVEAPKLVSPEYLLTYRQLYSFYSEEFNKDPEKYLKAKHGEKKFNLDHRASLGDSTADAKAPGSIYQIDSTKLDINMVLTLARFHVIGTPTVFIVSDVFSRAVVGFSLTIENASWRSALFAMDNAFSDKVSFCAQYGIPIVSSEWPSFGLPKRFLADNAEFMTKYSNKLTKNLEIDVSNTAPYMAIWKPIIEKRIDLSNQAVRSLPGGRQPTMQRGDTDPRRTACMTPYELTQILILTFLHYNNFHVLKSYVPDRQMKEDQVPLRPNDLLRWGMENRGGELRQVDRQKVMFSLLPDCQISVTENGFKFKGKIYHGGDAARERRLTTLAKSKGGMSFPGVYDPKKPDTLYCQLEGRKSFEKLKLADEYEAYLNLHEMEWDEQDDLDKRTLLTLSYEERQEKISTDANINVIVAKAESETDAAIQEEGASRRSRITNMDQNREKERELERQQRPLIDGAEATTLDRQEMTPTNTPVQKNKYIPSPGYSNFIRNMEKEQNDEKQ
jgi:putative transposase